MATPEQKLEKLASILRGYGSVLVAFSGGVDSSLLLKVAVDTLGGKAVAFTEESPLHHSWELTEARELARLFGARHVVHGLDPAATLADRTGGRPHVLLRRRHVHGHDRLQELGMGLEEELLEQARAASTNAKSLESTSW